MEAALTTEANVCQTFEGKKKIISFMYMATLTKYNTFKSLKQHSSVNVQKATNHKKMMEAEMEAFLQLLSKTKAKKGLK